MTTEGQETASGALGVDAIYGLHEGLFVGNFGDMFCNINPNAQCVIFEEDSS